VVHETGRIRHASKLLPPDRAQNLGTAHLPALDHLSPGSQLGVIVRIITRIAPEIGAGPFQV
jgi:hypothetical protein